MGAVAVVIELHHPVPTLPSIIACADLTSSVKQRLIFIDNDEKFPTFD